MRKVFPLVALVLLVGSESFAASFDCAKAGTLVEKAICSDVSLSEMDSVLSRTYKAALANSLAPDALKAEQKAWLSGRNRCQDTGCLKAAYQARISDLQEGAGASSAMDGVTGTYKSENSQVLILQTSQDRFSFVLNAAYEMNVGEVFGEALLNNDSAAYSGEDGDCTMLFKFSGRKVEVSQDGSCGMGLNVSGAGDYILISKNPPDLTQSNE